MQYFTRDAFACKCRCGFDTVDYQLVEILDKVREHFDAPMHINSGCRCATYNKKVHKGRVTKSQHILGRAADVRVDGVTPQLVAEAAAQYGATGIKAYNTFTHIDTRSGQKWRE